jgi:basic membrane protein A
MKYGLSKTSIAIIIVAIIALSVILIWAYIIMPAFKATMQSSEQPKLKYKLAALFPGTIQDADYNTLGYLAINDLKASMGIDVAYSERVAVADAERIMREYISLGYNVIWAHGGQFLSAVLSVAKQYPNIIFIGEADTPVKDQPANVWIIDRNFHTGFYVLGAIAALSTKSGKIGYIGGQDLPFSKAEINAIKEAINRYNPNATLLYLWVGDFNDPVKAKSAAETLIAQGVDIILSSVNLGNYGIFEAIKAGGKKILVTVKYTDKSSFIPEAFITSYIYDFGVALKYIMNKIIQGQYGGYYKMKFGEACYILFPLKNVPKDVEEKARGIIDDIVKGRITIEFNDKL